MSASSPAARRGILIFAGSAMMWLLVQRIGVEAGWSPALLLGFDLLALVGFVLGAVVAIRAWRRKE